jgi:uncharacterized membrane protein
MGSITITQIFLIIIIIIVRNIANVDSKQFYETVEYIISACPILAKDNR